MSARASSSASVSPSRRRVVPPRISANKGSMGGCVSNAYASQPPDTYRAPASASFGQTCSGSPIRISSGPNAPARCVPNAEPSPPMLPVIKRTPRRRLSPVPTQRKRRSGTGMRSSRVACMVEPASPQRSQLRPAGGSSGLQAWSASDRQSQGCRRVMGDASVCCSLIVLRRAGVREGLPTAPPGGLMRACRGGPRASARGPDAPAAARAR